MNQLTPHRTAAPATAKPVTRADQIASGLRRVNESLIAPRRHIRETIDGLYKRTGPIVREGLPRRSLLLQEDGRAEDLRRQIRGDLAAIPTLDVLRHLEAQAEATFSQTPDRPQNRLLIGLMVDAFPNARPHSPETYFEVLVHEISESGFAPAAVACALREVVRTAKFLPAVAEILEACEKEAAAQRSDAAEIARAIKARELLEEASRLIDAYEAGERYTPPPPPPRTTWKEGDPIPF